MARVLLLVLMFCVFSIEAREGEMMTISYGDVSTDLEAANADPSGWRINVLFETPPSSTNVTHGLSIGYIKTTADVTNLGQATNYKLESLPIYYAPKMLFGKSAFKGFFKGALGMHYSKYKRTGALGEASANDLGFYGGASLGAMFMFNETVFINAEYEWAYLSNSYYQDGEVTSAMVGLGFKF